MMNTKMMKKTAVAALVGVLGYGAVGAAEVSASSLNAPQRVTQPAFSTAEPGPASRESRIVHAS